MVTTITTDMEKLRVALGTGKELSKLTAIDDRKFEVPV
jgi:hypothetical protein